MYKSAKQKKKRTVHTFKSQIVAEKTEIAMEIAFFFSIYV